MANILHQMILQYRELLPLHRSQVWLLQTVLRLFQFLLPRFLEKACLSNTCWRQWLSITLLHICSRICGLPTRLCPPSVLGLCPTQFALVPTAWLKELIKSDWPRRSLLKVSRKSDTIQCSAEGTKNPHSFPHSASWFPLYWILSSCLSPHDWNTGAAWLRHHQTQRRMHVWFYRHRFSELWRGRPTLSAGWKQILAFTASWRKKDREDRNRKQSRTF